MMKVLILILFFNFCQYISCNEEMIWLTDEEIYELFEDGSVPTYGIARLRIPDSKVELDAESTWNFSIPFSDGTTKHLNLKLTEGLLIDNNTPAWYARLANNSYDIAYENVSILEKFGKFDMYQDYEQKAAVVVFHDEQLIEGFVQFYYFKSRTNYTDNLGPSEREYVLVPDPENADYPDDPEDPLTEDAPIQDEVRVNFKQEPLRDNLPTIVYPQLLIQLDTMDVQTNLMKTLRQMIAYWNAVDMLYSIFENPKIKINIAGFILPTDEFSVPWFKLQNDALGVYNELANHFHRYSHIFPDHSFDIMFTFVRPGFLPKNISGITQGELDCSRRNARVGLFENNWLGFTTAAHELAHTFSAKHDGPKCGAPGIMAAIEQKSETMYEWTSCAKESISKHFTKTKSQCLDNCPRTKQNCNGNSPCVRHPDAVCSDAMHFPSFATNVACEGYLSCRMHGSWKKFPTLTLEGTICKRNGSIPTAACHWSECRPIDPDTPVCLSQPWKL